MYAQGIVMPTRQGDAFLHSIKKRRPKTPFDLKLDYLEEQDRADRETVFLNIANSGTLGFRFGVDVFEHQIQGRGQSMVDPEHPRSVLVNKSGVNFTRSLVKFADAVAQTQFCRAKLDCSLNDSTV